MGASVSDFVIAKLNLPSKFDVVAGSPASLTPSLSRSCHIVASPSVRTDHGCSVNC